ncbi:SusD/RagB family nutrient-binding outer membrane lipoprotein [Aestuariibaculum lutulentum]|uniref:SusD/RagB family nutrient-binding outer membrane lipoprotein n=1 Tax=Aestuariibaculum lutulentum TaxID=2920935 RepID=A0ABS9RF47_9FLAO|nr:SusD/RagB family nutrient-binding outer membrane lipoprotein [Aestuariibaculum lutulentum]MCH4551527.1 SusD/RagB family nutrient-binding outer membrane lipoprotein [Aestuariibaculum lutulentum]
MKKIILIATAIIIASCSNNLEDLNKNIKDPDSVSGESLFTSAQKALVDQITTLEVNENNTKLWSQFLQETTYTDESNYDQVTRTIPENLWSAMYRDVLKDFDEAEKIISETDYLSDEEATFTDNKLTIIEILKVYTFAHLVETFGNVPYSEALNIDILSPKYDDGMTIYKDLISRLTTAIDNLDTTKDSFINKEDNIFDGDVASWKRFASSLKLRMGIVLADADNSFAQTTVEDAISSGLITNSDQNANMQYLSAAPNTHPVHKEVVLSGRNDFVAAVTLTDILNNLNDPRRPLWLQTVDGDYVGGDIGSPSSYASHSPLSEEVAKANAPGVIMSYSEVQFLLAEAAARGYTTGDTAANHYAAGITASILEWGGSTTDATTYLAQPTVDYTTLTATKTWREVIGTQRWISLFNRGVEAWLSIRIMDFPAMAEPEEAVSGFPNRYTYPIVEQTINGDNYQEASTAIGGDMAETKLFFDKF